MTRPWVVGRRQPRQEVLQAEQQQPAATTTAEKQLAKWRAPKEVAVSMRKQVLQLRHTRQRLSQPISIGLLQGLLLEEHEVGKRGQGWAFECGGCGIRWARL